MKGQRKSDRLLIALDVVINNTVKATTLDISENGMYIASQAEFILGSKIELSFKIKDRPFQVMALIQHSQPGIGFGIKFLSPPPELLFAIRDLYKTDKIAPSTKTILFVDDSLQTRAIYKHKLQNEGFNVIEATNGVEAFKILREQKPDLVILDLWLEDIDGFKLLQLMNLNPDLKDIPVIILSARSLPSDIEKAISLGAKEFLPKATTTPVKLCERVRMLIA